MTLEKQLFSPDEMTGAIKAVAAAIVSKFPDPADFVLVGLYKQGVPLMEKIAEEISRLTGKSPQTGKLDITMYRDDFGKRSGLPLIRETVIPFDLNGENIILVDDVLSSGRTIRAALDALTDYGRPALIRLAVLVDRGNPEFPIRADFVGFSNNSPAEHKIVVQFDDNGSPAGVYEKNWNQSI
ncbi:MAG: bifunctional pyr operon transcriptional regulator/uracil phosphoribosyltransferase PyrR [Lentisphaeria bacterium]|nr:bifunctional pyr operon transcriptional regulator/uracil phosphoribosyltransferase PyrR [Lentisphaeria bacterium]MBQ9774822.1 bifunctional pyr operon transcriptional regulator/uracil phosphoribosyltransferase PyrR [Lentisphaeria bacterium]